ncbi:glycoside hydrolase family 3 C-terminal domain-containing protein [Draconibacterium orientale]|nr:glycoside hydrolase family 3 C-terminal domain-containing protein [Draconibacterium orientale]
MKISLAQEIKEKSNYKAGFVILFLFLFVLSGTISAQSFTAATASTNQPEAGKAFDANKKTGWELSNEDLTKDQYIMFVLASPGDVKEVHLQADGFSAENLKKMMDLYITYDPMNLGEPLDFDIKGKGNFVLSFAPKYGAHLRLQFKRGIATSTVSLNEVGVSYAEAETKAVEGDRPWMDADLPVKARVDLLLAAMTPADKMELLREGWGIPGIPHLGIPFLNKVEAIHGYSYGSGATIFPQAIGLGASWDKKLAEEVAGVIGDETKAAHTLQAWSPVLDVAQDARWGRCEETYGEDPVLVSQIGGAWIKGYQSKGLLVTPKHFAAHGAPLGGRDSHDIGLSEREMREIHLVPFRHVFRTYNCQSVMESYSDYLGVPVAKSKELLHRILREEWGFEGYIVSDCGAIGNMTSRKHYVAKDEVEAANLALAAGIATNCGDIYNNKSVIEAAQNGELDMEALDAVCSSMLETIFRNGLFEDNPSKPLDWNTIYPGWNSPEHKEMAHLAALKSIVLLENKNEILPFSNDLKSIAVIGPGADDLQPGDYTAKLQEGQLKSVLTGLKQRAGDNIEINFAKGCEFISDKEEDFNEALEAAKSSDIAVLVLGDCSTSESTQGIKKTSGEANDYASLILPGNQQKLLEAVCETGKPVILVLQVGRPYNLSYAKEHCAAILVNWLPGQEGGPATADVLFGDYNPAGRLPMTFPRDVAQLPLYYNFKTSGRGYNYVDMPFYPLYSFGYGLSYTNFNYSNLKVNENADGTVDIAATVTNVGERDGEEVVQLYVTDMYASVKTRVMELKDFDRIQLAAGESREIQFKLTPYQLSLLDENMDRVVESGQFKILLGGKSPEYVAADRIKDSVGFETSADGVSTMLNYTHSFKADFDLSFAQIDQATVEGKTLVNINVKNDGTITDVGKVKIFVDGVQQEEIHHYELTPGEEKIIQFKLEGRNMKNLVAVAKYKSIAQTL